MLSCDVNPDSAGDQARDSWAQREELGNERGRRDDVLEVVKNEQGVFGTEEGPDPIRQ